MKTISLKLSWAGSRKLFASLGILGVALFTTFCATGESRNRSSALLTPGSPTPQEAQQIGSPSLTSTLNAPIRSVDFDHIAYPNLPDYSGDKSKRNTLKPGEGGPSHINYVDVTGDGQEEAIVVIPIGSRGSTITYHVYIFTIEQERPKLLWDFDTGDRADGGLRQVSAEGGELVIDLYGKDRVVGGQLFRGEEGLCCPSSFTRAHNKWTGKRFELVSKETLSNPTGDAKVVMPLYTGKSQVGRSK
jgi:hypothetical protein